jgi:hypothetical protein
MRITDGPPQSQANLWPYAIRYANDSLNNAKRTPSVQRRLGSKYSADPAMQPDSLAAPFCPAYVLEKALQTGSFQNKWRKKHSRIWEDRRFMHEVWHWF